MNQRCAQEQNLLGTLETLRTEIAWSGFKTEIPVGNK